MSPVLELPVLLQNQLRCVGGAMEIRPVEPSDVRWHDGVSVTARDVRLTVDLYGHLDVLWTTPGTIEATVVDDTTFTIPPWRRPAAKPCWTSCRMT